MANGFNPREVWAPAGRAFSQGVIAPTGHTVYVTGQVAWDQNNDVVGAADVRLQMEQCVRNIEAILEPVGGRLDDIVSMTIYFLRHEDLPVIQEVRSAHFPVDGAPVSTLIQVAGLVRPEFLVELVPIAVVPNDRFRDPS